MFEILKVKKNIELFLSYQPVLTVLVTGCTIGRKDLTLKMLHSFCFCVILAKLQHFIACTSDHI